LESKKRKTIRSENKPEKEVIPSEKWLVSFKNHHNSRASLFPRIIIRQFYAQGYYEAYDMIRSYAEKLSLEIMWFKEKRNCSNLFISKTFPLLESICIYCNRIFNDLEPIPCLKDDCIHMFCSTYCLEKHIIFKHLVTK
jgi:hypothetical protein